MRYDLNKLQQLVSDRKRRTEEKESVYVYIIKNVDSNNIKVGISKDPEKRVAQLKTGSDSVLELLFSEKLECTRYQVLNIEKQIHKELSESFKRLNGEWFKVSTVEDIEKAKDIIKYNRIRYENDYTYFTYHEV